MTTSVDIPIEQSPALTLHSDSQLRGHISHAVNRLLLQVDRDPYSPTFGCFDRRYWSWKLVDYSEATYQRGVYVLAIYRSYVDDKEQSALLLSVVDAGLQYCCRIQHADGSFDQAFPNEHSFGATAFLLNALAGTYSLLADDLPANSRERLARCIALAADFLCANDESHGFISNHLAGAALGLARSAQLFSHGAWKARANSLVESILNRQSAEGWYLEYDGADPGYQSLAIHYLAQLQAIEPSPQLQESLQNAVEFVSFFIHPDGSYAGEYGSRRTAVLYPGGIAVLALDSPVARTLLERLLDSYRRGIIFAFCDVDAGNLSPLAESYLICAGTKIEAQPAGNARLPCDTPNVIKNFHEAGIFLRGTAHYYAVIGASNGGMVKLFDKKKRRIILDDCGYVGTLRNGTMITTQIHSKDRQPTVTDHTMKINSGFFRMPQTRPTPMSFLVLRALNISLMRSLVVGNWIKRLLVRVLISRKHSVPMNLERSVTFDDRHIEISDTIRMSQPLDVVALEKGRRFVAIHMASSRYFGSIDAASRDSIDGAIVVDADELSRENRIEVNQSWSL